MTKGNNKQGRGAPAAPAPPGRPRGDRGPVSRLAALLGARMRKLRKRSALSIQDACARIGGAITWQSWSNYENGLQEPGIARFILICRALGVAPGKMLSGLTEAAGEG